MKKYLLLLSLLSSFIFADGQLIYFINGTHDSVQGTLTIDVKANRNNSDTPAYGRDSNIVPIIPKGYIIYETDDTITPDDIFLIYESGVKVHDRHLVYIRSTSNDKLENKHLFSCYFYKGDIDFTLSVTEYSSNNKVYYDYGFNYLPNQDNDVIILDNQSLINSSNDDLSKACRATDVSVEEYLQGLDSKKHKTIKKAK